MEQLPIIVVVPAEDRVREVPAEDRARRVEAEDRVRVVTPEGKRDQYRWT